MGERMRVAERPRRDRGQMLTVFSDRMNYLAEGRASVYWRFRLASGPVLLPADAIVNVHRFLHDYVIPHFYVCVHIFSTIVWTLYRLVCFAAGDWVAYWTINSGQAGSRVVDRVLVQRLAHGALAGLRLRSVAAIVAVVPHSFGICIA